MSEEDLCKVLVWWLKELDWEVYQEVDLGGSSVDVVATKGSLLWAIEAKTSIGAKVIDQAVRWTGQANLISVFTAHSYRAAYCYRDYMGLKGIGWLTGDFTVSEKIRPRLLRRCGLQIRRHLHERQKTYAPAGNAYGARWSPFRQTCEALKGFVQANPECSMKAAVDGIKHHYASASSARNSLATWIVAGKVPGVAYKDAKLSLEPSE